jgi:hypothetical protein
MPYMHARIAAPSGAALPTLWLVAYLLMLAAKHCCRRKAANRLQHLYIVRCICVEGCCLMDAYGLAAAGVAAGRKGAPQLLNAFPQSVHLTEQCCCCCRFSPSFITLELHTHVHTTSFLATVHFWLLDHVLPASLELIVELILKHKFFGRFVFVGQQTPTHCRSYNK